MSARELQGENQTGVKLWVLTKVYRKINKFKDAYLGIEPWTSIHVTPKSFTTNMLLSAAQLTSLLPYK